MTEKKQHNYAKMAESDKIVSRIAKDLGKPWREDRGPVKPIARLMRRVKAR